MSNDFPPGDFPPLLNKKPDVGGTTVPPHTHDVRDVGGGGDVGEYRKKTEGQWDISPFVSGPIPTLQVIHHPQRVRTLQVE